MKRHVAIFGAVMGLAFASQANATIDLTHDYQLNGSLADSLGGPSLTLSGAATLGATGVTIVGGHSGLTLLNALTAFSSGTAYSVQMGFTPSSVNGYRRLINTSNNDNGFYIREGNLVYYEAGSFPGTGVFTANTPLDVVFARDASGVSIYLNGILDSSFSPGGFSPPSSEILADMKFFIDDAGEETGGTIDFIKLYDSKLTGSDVATLYGAPAAVPEPASWAMMIMGFGLMGGMMRRRAARTKLSFA